MENRQVQEEPDFIRLVLKNYIVNRKSSDELQGEKQQPKSLINPTTKEEDLNSRPEEPQAKQKSKKRKYSSSSESEQSSDDKKKKKKKKKKDKKEEEVKEEEEKESKAAGKNYEVQILAAKSEIERLEKLFSRSEVSLLLLTNLVTLLNYTSDLEAQLLLRKRVNEVFNTMIDLFDKEQFINDESNMNLNSSFQLATKSGKWQEFEIKLKQLIKDHIPLDVGRLSKYLQMSKDSIPQVRGQQIIIFIGNIGNGKSTIIHYLAGSKMEYTMENRVPHIKPKIIMNEEANNILSSNSTQSVTKFLTTVHVTSQDENFILLDSPGFKDSAGPYADIVNGIHVIKAIKTAKSVIPIVVCGFRAMGCRLEGLRELINVLAQMINSPKDNLEEFQYVFTGFPKDYKHEQLEIQVKELIQEAEEDNAELIYKKLLQQLRYKLIDEKGVYFINPLDSNYKKILRQITSQDAFTKPDQIFKTYITTGSMNTLNQQTHKINERFLKALKRGDLVLCNEYLNELWQLNDATDQESVKKKYDECCDIISKEINNNFENAQQIIHQAIFSDNNLIDDKIKEFDTISLLDGSTQCLKDTHLKDKNCIKNEDYKSLITSKAKELEKQISGINIDATQIRQLFVKLNTLKDHYNFLQDQYDQTRYDSMKKFEELISQFNQKENFDETEIQTIKQIRKSMKNLETLFNSEIVKQKVDAMINSFHEKIEDQCSQLIKKLDNTIYIDKERLQQFNDLMNQLQSIKELLQGGQKLIPSDLIENDITNLVEYINKYYNDHCTKIGQLLEIIDAANYDEVEKRFTQIFDIRTKCSLINQSNQELYYSLFVNIKETSNKIKADNLQIIQQLQNDADEDVYIKLKDQLTKFQELKWIDRFEQGFFNTIFQDLKIALQKKVYQLQNIILSVPINENHPLSFKQLAQATFELNELNKIDIKSEIFEKDLIQSSLDHVSSEIQKIFKRIDVDLDKTTFCTSIVSEDKSQRDEENKQTEIQTASTSNISSGYFTLESQKLENYIIILNQFIQLNSQNLIMTKEFMNNAALAQEKIFKLVNNIKMQSEQTNNLLLDYFEKVRSYNGANRIELIKNASYIMDVIEELEKVEEFTNFKLIFNQKINVLAIFIYKLNQYCIELSNEMTQLIMNDQLNKLQIKLQIAQELKKFDKYVKNDIETFRQMHSSFFQQFMSKAPQELLRHSQLIKEQKYAELKAILIQFDNELHEDELIKKQKQEIGINLKYNLDSLINKTVNLAQRTKFYQTEDIQQRDLGEIQQMLLKIEECLLLFSTPKKFVDFNQEEYLKKHDQIKDIIIQNYVKKLKQAIELLQTSNFYEAEQLSNEVENAIQILPDFNLQLINEKKNDFREKRKKKFEDLNTSYKGMDIIAIIIKPPKEIHAKLQKLDNKRVYSQALEAFEQILLEKFQQELENIELAVICSENKLRKLTNVKTCLLSIPDKLGAILEISISSLEELIKSKQQDQDEKVQESIENKDINNIQKILDKNNAGEKVNSKTIKEIHCFLKNQNNELEKELLLQVRENGFQPNLTEQLIFYQKINQLSKTYFLSDFNKFKDVIQELTNLMTNSVNALKLYDQRKAAHQQLQINDSISDYYSEQGSSKLTKDEEQLDIFIKIRKDNKIFIQEFIPSFDLVLNQRLQKINKELKIHIEQFQESLNNSKYEVVADKVEIIKNYNIVHQKLINSIKIFASLQDQNQIENYSCLLKFCIKSEIEQELLQKVKKAQQWVQANMSKLDKKAESKNSIKLFYQELSFYAYDIQMIQTIIEGKVKYDLQVFYEDTKSKMKQKLKQIEENILVVGGEKFKIEEENCQKIEDNYKKLKYAKKFLKIEDIQVDNEIFTKIKTQIEAFSISLSETIKDNQDVEIQAQVLVQLKTLSENICSFKKDFETQIDKQLKNIQKEQGGMKKIEAIRQILSQNTDTYSGMIVSDHKIFKGFNISLFNESTQKHDIHYVLQQIEGDRLDKKQIKSNYQEFQEEYEKLIKDNLNPCLSKTQKNIQKLAQSLSTLSKPDKKKLTNWEGKFKKELITYMARIFAIYTLLNSEHYFEASDLQQSQTFLLKPHAAQVVAIFRMLGIGTYTHDDEKLLNNLVQVGTGEGKSIILGATSTIFALLGFEVYCACYSKFLSQRDSDEFQKLFEILQIQNYVHYGTFNDLCERIITNDFDLREMVRNTINGQGSKIINNKLKRPTVLLIDEVDVFFSMDFFGETYSPIVQYTTPQIQVLVNYIWNSKNNQNKVSISQVTQSQEYKNMLTSMGQWAAIAEEAVKDMISDLQIFKSHNYFVKQGKIGYKFQDEYVYNQNYGYQTMWAYFHEFQMQNQISAETKNIQTCLQIKCGHLSFAEIPKSFTFIVGVTGTLKTLTIEQMKIINDQYDINIKTFMPSVFGKNNLKFDQRDDFKISPNQDYFNDIIKDINNRLTRKRSVIVFFEDEKSLNEFYEYQGFDQYKFRVELHNRILTEKLTMEEKKERIKHATTSEAITLSTRSFGRGTDFIQKDIIVKDNGGVHIIQTFFSDDYSEEVQIKGRTARQGADGSFTIILHENQLDKLKLVLIKDPEDPESIAHQHYSYYDLDNKRKQNFRQLILNNQSKVVQAALLHKDAQNLIEAIKKSDTHQVANILQLLNKGILRGPLSSTIIMIDGTGSMGTLFEKAKATVEVMIKRIVALLVKNNIPDNVFEMQICIYRNYSSGPNQILESSPWTSKADELKRFLQLQQVSGGQGYNEAIEVGLWHAANEKIINGQGVTQVIIIGDASPNTEQCIKIKRGSKFKSTRFKGVQHYQQELNKLIDHKIPVHTFYLNEWCQESFQDISRQSGGESGYLDIDSDQGAQDLTNMINLQLMSQLQQSTGKDLVKQYANQYCDQKRYFS